MLTIIAAATLSAMFRDLGPLFSIPLGARTVIRTSCGVSRVFIYGILIWINELAWRTAQNIDQGR